MSEYPICKNLKQHYKMLWDDIDGVLCDLNDPQPYIIIYGTIDGERFRRRHTFDDVCECHENYIAICEVMEEKQNG